MRPIRAQKPDSHGGGRHTMIVRRQLSLQSWQDVLWAGVVQKLDRKLGVLRYG